MSERITVTDVQRAGFCVAGLRRWLEDRGVNVRDFIRDGIDAEDERIAGDALTERVLETKRKGVR